jgi:2-keto-myo-inositol isomerase
MKWALNQATLMRTPTDEFLAAARAAGFAGVELRHTNILEYLQRRSARELARRLESLGLECVTINALELFSLCPEAEFASILDLCRRLMEVGEEIGCRTIVAVPSFLDGPRTEADVVELTRERLARIAGVAARHGFRIAFEPLGFPACSVRTLDLARRILACDRLPGIGLVVDTFHFFVGGHAAGDLERIGRDAIWLIHLDDAPDRPPESLSDSDRVFPSEGSFDLPGFFRGLSAIGYDGWVSLELFNEEVWAMPPGEAAQRAMSSMTALV